jgi:hypothetical protein
MHIGLECRVRKSLESAVGRLEEQRGIWRFLPPRHSSLEMCAWLDGSWLRFDSTPSAAGKSARWMMERNAGLGGLAKFSLVPDDPRCHLRAELPLDEEIVAAARIAEVCAAFADASKLLDRRRPGRRAAQAESGQCPAQNFAEICRESGWDCQERSSGELSIELEIPDGFNQATLAPTDTGHLRLFAQIVDEDSASEVSRAALAAMLARACGSFRMIRAAMAADSERAEARMELLWVTPPTPYELSEGLCALSVAVRLCGEEARVLARDEAVARAYLVRREVAPEPHRERRTRRGEGTPVPPAMKEVALNARPT